MSKSLLNKEIEWEEHVCPKRGNGITRSGKVVAVSGKNILVDIGGTHDWKWKPQMHNLRIKKA